MAVQWKIYYADGTTHTNEQSIPRDIPNRYGVACIQQFEPVLNREILNRWPLYRWVATDGLWFGTTDEGIVDRLLHRLPVLGLICGVPLSRVDFGATYSVALNDPDFTRLPKNYDSWESPRSSEESALV